MGDSEGTSQLEIALRHAAEGYAVFPAIVGGGEKKPAIKGWQTQASWGAHKVRELFQVPHNSVGILPARHRDFGSILALDIDVKHGKDGRAVLLKLEMEGFELPDTRRHQRAGSEGCHLIFSAPHDVERGRDLLGVGVDVPRFLVAYPSDDTPIAPAPNWLLERCKKRERKPLAEVAPENIDRERAISRAVAYLQNEAPPSIEGHGGNDNAYKTACRVKDFGVGAIIASGMMFSGPWNERCEPPWSVEELDAIVDSAYKNGRNPVGSAAPEADFEPISDEAAPTGSPHAFVAEMNERYAVTIHHGQVMVHEQFHDHELGHVRHRWSTFENFERRFRGYQVKVVSRDGKVVWRDRGKAWLDSPQKRQYDGEVFLPGREAPANLMNLWRGFAVNPAAGDWSKFRAHLLNGICDYDKAAFEYVLNWLARLVQRPSEHGQTALVLQGDEGTGKGIFGRAIVALCGQHGIHLTQTRHLVGNFNQHLRNKVAAFADEALFAGDPSIRGPLFALITEDTVQFEAKGVDSETGANCLHIVMATNEDWAIPAGVNARRFCVLRVSSAHRQDTAHFGAIEAELRAGGLAAMLHDLQARDISDFNVFALPATAALGDQKIRSLRGPERWLLDCLQRGRLGFDPWGADPLKVSKTNAYDAYRSAARENREHSPKDIATWAKSVKGALGECWRETKLWAGGMRSRQLVFAALPDSRAAFERYIKQKIEWETDIDHGGEDAIA